jgi:ABC-type transport system involved in multi-copper enzyme maturation permease subunit
MINTFRAEWILLNRRRLWVVAGLTTVLFTILATTLAISTAKPFLQAPDAGLVLEALIGSGGATAAVIFSVAFSSILVLAAFASSTGNEFTRGTLRAALTHQPRRWALMGGKLAARMTVAAILMALALVVGAATSAIVAPAQDIDTTGWFGVDAVGQAAGDYVRLLGFVVVYALIGTTVAVLVRSTPIALAIGLVWFGPFENVIGEGRAWADRWFPGLLLRSMLQPDNPGSISTGTAVATLAVYAAACTGVIAVVMARRDVTS